MFWSMTKQAQSRRLSPASASAPSAEADDVSLYFQREFQRIAHRRIVVDDNYEGALCWQLTVYFHGDLAAARAVNRR
jgi:hypothetical protein